MPLFKKKKTDDAPKQQVQPQVNYEKLSIFITIVNHGLADPVVKLFQNFGVSAQFIQRGEGTATRQIRDILGIEDTGKDIVISIIKKDKIEEVKPDLWAFFSASKYNKGIGFSIPMTSMIGVKVYQFLSNSL